mmetsp:Transcript_85002/g.197652  ORF Transcript_85002/g.197652 Transcript_85002/m.197652 type:complete len:201 (+) Transcript_85002:407-1009(+)
MRVLLWNPEVALRDAFRRLWARAVEEHVLADAIVELPTAEDSAADRKLANRLAKHLILQNPLAFMQFGLESCSTLIVGSCGGFVLYALHIHHLQFLGLVSTCVGTVPPGHIKKTLHGCNEIDVPVRLRLRLHLALRRSGSDVEPPEQESHGDNRATQDDYDDDHHCDRHSWSSASDGAEHWRCRGARGSFHRAVGPDLCL